MTRRRVVLLVVLLGLLPGGPAWAQVPASPREGLALQVFGVTAGGGMLLAAGIALLRRRFGRPGRRGPGSAWWPWPSSTLPATDRIEVLARRWLGGRESIAVVRVGAERFLLGIGATGITLLSRFEGPPSHGDFDAALREAARPDATDDLAAAIRRARTRLARAVGAGLALVLLAVAAGPAAAQIAVPRVSVEAGLAKTPEDVATAVQVLLVLTVLSLAPAILLMLTSFTRIVIVLSLVRQAIGIQQLPPNQVIIGLSLFLTVFVMAPVGAEVHRAAWEPYAEKRISQTEALTRALGPLRAFMLRQTRQQDLALMTQLGRLPQPRTAGDLPTHVLVPAFALSEIKTAFQMGFLIFVPFLVIDMIVASVLMSMGMLMLPPVTISIPLKLCLFVLADGWHLVVKALVEGYR